MAILCAAAERGVLIKNEETNKESSCVKLKVFRPTSGDQTILIERNIINTKLVSMSAGAIILVHAVAATVAWVIFAASHTMTRQRGPESMARRCNQMHAEGLT